MMKDISQNEIRKIAIFDIKWLLLRFRKLCLLNISIEIMKLLDNIYFRISEWNFYVTYDQNVKNILQSNLQ